MQSQNIRIRLKAFDHRILDNSTREIVNTAMTAELIAPIAMDEGLRFAIREGGRTVASGRVTKILK